jgi:ACT domain-containing protein
MKKSIITVVGKDRVGIIAAVCTYLSNHNINILDIDQSISQGYFHMMMIVDANAADLEYSRLVSDLEEIGTQMGVQIKMQHEDIFNVMHRI